MCTTKTIMAQAPSRIMKYCVRHDGFPYPPAGQGGLTLIELLIFIVVVGIAVAGVLSAMNATAQHSSDPLIRKQALAIAESLLEEILAREYNDPDGQPLEASRALYDDVGDYHGLSLNGISDMNGAAIAGLEAYSAAVAVADTTLGGIVAKRISVAVAGPGGETVALAGYRTGY